MKYIVVKRIFVVGNYTACQTVFGVSFSPRQLYDARVPLELCHDSFVAVKRRQLRRHNARPPGFDDPATCGLLWGRLHPLALL